MKLLNIVFLLALALIIQSCIPQGVSNLQSNTTNDNSYIIKTEINNILKTEFQEYKCLSEENRKIFVYGKIDPNSDNRWQYIWINNDLGTEDQHKYLWASDVWYDYDKGQFTIPMEIEAPFTGQKTFTVYAGASRGTPLA